VRDQQKNREYQKRCREKNPERHLQNHRVCQQRYREKHPERYLQIRRESNRRCWLKNRLDREWMQKQAIRNRRWRQTNQELYKLKDRKAKALRHRGIRTDIILNHPFVGCEMHHLGSGVAIFIPASLHKGVRHSLLRNRNMEEMNRLAYGWWEVN